MSHPAPALADALYRAAQEWPLICPHGHVDPAIFADPDYRFGSPVDLLIIPDHYVFRMFYSQGIPLEQLGIPARDGTPVETDHRRIWQRVADHWHLFRGTPTGQWIRDELREVFGIDEKLTSANAQAIYDVIDARLREADFTPRRLFERFRIEVLATTDAATDPLPHHQALRASGWDGRVIPTFRPDALLNVDHPEWTRSVEQLNVGSYRALIQALEERRAYFRSMGATATDHAALTPYTEHLSDNVAEVIFQRARRGQATAREAARFTGHLLIEMARMSVEDGLVMQLHVGSYRNHNPRLYERFGPDKGADIPIQTEFTRNLQPLLARFGNDPRLTLILFTLDESAYSRELAPLAGHYPALRLGPPWWFHDSYNGMRRYFDHVMETAGLYNTAGFNDDTRAFLSIPARHSLWRRASADWLAGLAARGAIDEDDAHAMIGELAYGLAKAAYRL
ncbi:MAG: glucuronate isomerase [Anaerolinea sp.]